MSFDHALVVCDLIQSKFIYNFDYWSHKQYISYLSISSSDYCHSPSAMSEAIALKRCGVRFTPPALMITYTKDGGRLHRRTMPLRNFNKNSGVTRIVQEMKQSKRHEKYLRQMSALQLEKLVTILHDQLNGMSLDESVSRNKGSRHTCVESVHLAFYIF